ncbi:MAG: hypothetical protein MJ016_00190 [Victivallaceae bacterium]|nr:hypothetical protein [Victivallaceae bacterium]
MCNEKSGWVDLQVNGHCGVDFSAPDLTESDFLRAADELFAAGTEVFLPTLVTRDAALYRCNLPLIRRAVEKHRLERQIPGVHLEGPMITAPGAHDSSLILECTPENVHFCHHIGEGFIRMMTLAADAPHSAEAIAEAKKLGIIPSVGHHLAGYDAVRRAADAGAPLLTHLGNACPNQIGRHENPIFAGLAESRMTAMIIADGHHLPGELVRLFFRVKGADGIIVTSDACSLCGNAPGEYRLWGNRAVLESCGRLYNPDRQCLVASVATMEMCMRYLRSLDFLSESELLKVGRTNALKLLNLQ